MSSAARPKSVANIAVSVARNGIPAALLPSAEFNHCARSQQCNAVREGLIKVDEAFV
jgi:hypothetical protein